MYRIRFIFKTVINFFEYGLKHECVSMGSSVMTLKTAKRAQISLSNVYNEQILKALVILYSAFIALCKCFIKVEIKRIGSQVGLKGEVL